MFDFFCFSEVQRKSHESSSIHRRSVVAPQQSGEGGEETGSSKSITLAKCNGICLSSGPGALSVMGSKVEQILQWIESGAIGTTPSQLDCILAAAWNCLKCIYVFLL